ncbi:DUF3846 domain-containing protein, partial [Dysosmobacter welbionis]
PPLRNIRPTPLSHSHYIRRCLSWYKRQGTQKEAGRCPPLPRDSLLPLLPVLEGLQLLIQAHIAGVAAPLDLASAHRLQHGAAFLLGVAAPHEAALVQIRPELHKGLRQAVLQLQIQLIGLKG